MAERASNNIIAIKATHPIAIRLKNIEANIWATPRLPESASRNFLGG
jgi:hypothetical protein